VRRGRVGGGRRGRDRGAGAGGRTRGEGARRGGDAGAGGALEVPLDAVVGLAGRVDDLKGVRARGEGRRGRPGEGRAGVVL